MPPWKSSNITTRSEEHYCNLGNVIGLRKQIFALLKENPLLTPKKLCELMKVSYKQYRNYVTKTKSEWKHYYQNELGSKPSNFHCFKAGTRLGSDLSWTLRNRVKANCESIGLGFGWRSSKAKNRFWIWENKLGKVFWYETGTVLLHVGPYGHLGNAKQLFCDAFRNSGLEPDFDVICPILDKIRTKSAHFTYNAKARLPYMVISDFERSHGLTIKTGDRTHPNALEVIASFAEPFDEVVSKINVLGSKVDGLVTVFDKFLGLLGAVESGQRVEDDGFGGDGYVC